MKTLFLTLLLVAASATAAPAQAGKPAAINWHDSTRDVYINNEIDRAAQVLVSDSPSRIALISSKLERAIILDMAERTVSAASKEAFHFSQDHASATSEGDAATKPIGRFTRVDGPVYFFAVEGNPILIRAHPGLTGEMSLDKLWETVPIWRSAMNDYRPNEGAVAALKANATDTKVTLVYGTWCPDSKNYIPRLVKALRAAGNDKIQVKLIGIDNQFREPIDTVQPKRITNVPTVIVERGGREIGRIVETPAAATIEEDLAAIMGGKPIPHAGRWERGPKLAAGVYSYRDGEGRERGAENWELFSTLDGGYLVHSRVTTGDQMTEVFHRLDARRRSTFVEITKQRGEDTTRTRYNLDGHTLTARTRGSVSGVISQTIEVPEGFFLSSPSVAAEGLLRGDEDQRQVTGYVVPSEFDRAMGTLTSWSYEAKGAEAVRVPAGEFRARHVRRNVGKESSEWWLHPQLGVAVKGQARGISYVLTALEAPANK
ncbi:MAG TPA: thioredoxin family protein [Blastocatellia bacterium]|jgi:thiol-disulfide isomerase/thioredoxin